MKDTLFILRDIVTYVIGATYQIKEEEEIMTFSHFQYNVPVSNLIKLEIDLNTSEEFIFTYVKETKELHIEKEIKVFNDFFEVYNSRERYTFYSKIEIDLNKFVLFLRPNYLGDTDKAIDWAKNTIKEINR